MLSFVFMAILAMIMARYLEVVMTSEFKIKQIKITRLMQTYATLTQIKTMYTMT